MQEKIGPAGGSGIEKDEDCTAREEFGTSDQTRRPGVGKSNGKQDDRLRTLLEKLREYYFQFLLAKQQAGEQQGHVLLHQLLRRGAGRPDEQAEARKRN